MTYDIERDPGIHLDAAQAWALWHFLERGDVPPWWEEEAALQEVHEVLKDWVRSDAGFAGGAGREEILDLDRRLALPGQTRLVGTPGTTYVGQVLEDIVAPPGFSFAATLEPTAAALQRVGPA